MLWRYGEFAISMLKVFFNIALTRNEVGDFSLSQKMVFIRENIVSSCQSCGLTSTTIRDFINCTTANLSMHVRKCFYAVENMSMWIITPQYIGMSVLCMTVIL